jgi:hypothetical protein
MSFVDDVILFCDNRMRLSIVDVDGIKTDASGSSFSTKCATDDVDLSKKETEEKK